jgi:hypothetical protein
MMDIVERLRLQLHDAPPAWLKLCGEAADKIELLRHDVATLRSMHQSYRDEIVEHFREIERLRQEVAFLQNQYESDSGYNLDKLYAEAGIKRTHYGTAPAPTED